jgi:2-keto-4-pentenoate hydratase/2-oxohepta-3-ene-1,7-dioic acid hydratase in catechol pathway
MRFLRLVHGDIGYYAELVDSATARLWTAAPWRSGTRTDRLVPLRTHDRLPPVEPSKIVCVGRNYRDHAKELGNEVPKEPLLFLKPPSALLGHRGAIELPAQSERVEHEGELAIVIGKRLRNATRAEAREGIFGLTCANDVTARDLQRKDVQFTRGKGFDTFCPCGPHVDTDASFEDLSIEVRVNGTVRQSGRTSQMIWPADELLEYVSGVMTLEAGDLVLTGTPAGVGPLVDGDVVEVAIADVGSLENRVRRRKNPDAPAPPADRA